MIAVVVPVLAILLGTQPQPDPTEVAGPNEGEEPREDPPTPRPPPRPVYPVWPEEPPEEPPPPHEPVEPEPVPPPRNPGGGGGGGTVEPGGGGGEQSEEPPMPAKPAPYAGLDVADRGSELNLGGDLTIGPRCKDDELDDDEIDEDTPLTFVCSNYRVGLRARLPVTQASSGGSGRAAIDSLNGFSGAWRVGGVFDWIRDVTTDESDAPAKFYQLSLEAAWGAQTFRFEPLGGSTAKDTRHSIQARGRFLAYVHPPRKTRVAPQVLVRYDRQWSTADPVGVPEDHDDDESTPAVTVPRIIDGPVTQPVLAVTVPVLLSFQGAKGRAGKVISQLGLGPAVGYAAAGGERGYNPFDDLHVLRLETWLYWYPTGKAGQLAASTPNVRLGVSPLVDVFLTGRGPGEPRVDYGILAEVRVGVRGFEY